MRRILSMVRKDLLRQRRAPMAISLVLAFPLVFASLLALTFGTGGSPEIPRVKLLVEDRDGSALSGLLVQASGGQQMAQHFDVRKVGAEGRELMERGEASALLVIPKGFGEALIEGEPVVLELVRNPAQGILPEIAEQAMTVAVDFLSATSRVLREPIDRIVEVQGVDAASPEQMAAISAAFHNTISRSQKLLLPPVITFKSLQLEDEDGEGGGGTRGLVFLIVLPGISVWALFLLGDMVMRDLLVEGEAGTLRRQMVGPVRAHEIVLAKALHTATLATISLMLLATIGYVAAGRSVDLTGFAVLSACLVLAVTGLSSAIYGVARTQRQAATVSSILYLIFAFMGGAFIQVDSLPSALRQFAPLSPFYWGTTGFQKLIREAGGVAEVLPNAGVLLAIGVVGLLAGSSLLTRQVMHGGNS